MNDLDSFVKRRYELRKKQFMKGLNGVRAFMLNAWFIPGHIKDMMWKPHVTDELEGDLKALADENKAIMDSISDQGTNGDDTDDDD